MTYCIVDVETTGRTNRITEICILKYKDGAIIDEFTSLVKSEAIIPLHITALTGIDNEMLLDAPTFEDIADAILKITEDAIFVAHNVNFDYKVIGNEFRRLEQSFVRKKLCTVRLSRAVFPNLNSYSLGKLCKSLDIEITDRHRAKGDAEATVKLFHLIEQQNGFDAIIAKALNKLSREATLPAKLPQSTFDKLPETPGIYYFMNDKNQMIYVGKAKNIKKRVLSHFYSKTKKSIQLILEISHIDFKESGGELIAYLMEDQEIKKNFPIYNTASKRRIKGFALCHYQDRVGVIHLAVNNLKMVSQPIKTFFTIREAKLFLDTLMMEYQLCPNYIHLQNIEYSCENHIIHSCKGICKQEETIKTYNKRVKKALKDISKHAENKVIQLPGRTTNEKSFVLIENGNCLGYGFIDDTLTISNDDDLKSHIIPITDNSDVQSILRRFDC